MSARAPFGRGGHARRFPPGTDVVALLKSFDPATRRAALALLSESDREALDLAWDRWAHPGQLAPPACPDGSPWSTWVIMAGRGFGKTLAGAQWVCERIAGQAPIGNAAAGNDAPIRSAPIRIALVGATIEDARRVMVEGPSGLIAVAGHWLDDWSPSRLRLTFRTGAQATLFSGARPDLLRGPEHHYAWCDELAKWDKPQAAWDMLQLGLRLRPPGRSVPGAVVTTTPRPGPVLRAIMDAPDTVVTGGPTAANPHLSAAWKRRVERLYAGTRLGRQELGGELLADAAGALWTVALIERCRIRNPPPDGQGNAQGDRAAVAGFASILIAVDPPAGEGTCGIVACARAGEGAAAQAHVLADHSVTGRSPEGWASAVSAAARAHGTQRVVAEANQGGQMVKAVLHAADPSLRVALVHARLGKSARAEPVAHLFEAGRVWLHGAMPALEAQLLGLIAGGGYEGPGRSPDRADAMVWGVSEVMHERAPRIWMA